MLCFLSVKKRPGFLNCILIARTGQCLAHSRYPTCNLDYGLCQLKHLHLNDELLEVLFCAIVLLFDDQLAFGLAEALNFAI